MELLSQWLSGKGYDVVKTREPGGTPLAEALRHTLLVDKEEVNERSELMLLLAARADHVEKVIAPALLQGKLVLCDRFNDSTIAYQGVARGLGVAFVEKLCHFSCRDITPSLTLLLDIDPAIGLERIRQRYGKQLQGADKVEKQSLQFHETIREAFLMLALQYPQRIKVIDAAVSKEQLFAEAQHQLQTRFGSAIK